MDRRFFLFAAVLTVTTACCGCDTSESEFTSDMAAAFLTSYTAAVERGDSAEVLEYWSEESRMRPGFWTMIAYHGGLLPFDQFQEFLRHHHFEIKEVRTGLDHHEIDIEWVPHDGQGEGVLPRPTSMRYYIVREQGQPVLIKPLDLLTHDWRCHETELFVFHFPRSLSAEEHRFEMQRMNDLSMEISSRLKAELDSKIHVYCPPDARQCGDLIVYPPSYGYAVVVWNVIVTTAFVNPHEFVHVVTLRDGSFINAAFSEGLAVALGGGAWFTPEFSLSQAKNLLDHPMYVPIAHLMLFENQAFLTQAEITYHEAGAFVSYLLDQYGWDTLLKCEATVDSGMSIVDAFKAVYGSSLKSEELLWINYMRALQLPEVGLQTPDSVRQLFVIEDPIGDDDGDGTYTYPLDERFRDGAFDLTRFSVSVDDDHVYFELGFRTIIHAVTDGTRDRTFVPGCVIAVRRDPAKNHPLQHQYLNVRFENGRGYDCRIDIGQTIQVVDAFGRCSFAGPYVRGDITHESSKSLSFALPMSLIGRPETDWEYFVGVFLADDAGTGFLRMFPRHMQARPQLFSIGCGSDPQAKAGFIDILVPEGRSQREILGNYGRSEPRPVVVPMLSPGCQ